MEMRTRDVAFAVVVLTAVLAFCALGVWQLGRHQEREATVAEKRARRDLPRLELTGRALAGPADSLDWRRARAAGRFAYHDEIVLRSRVHNGIPGVYVVTPLILEDGTGLPVVRGWLPAADGFDAPLATGRPGTAARDRPVAVEGVLVAASRGALPSVDSLSAGGRSHPVVGTLNGAVLERLLPDAVDGLYLHAVEGTSTGGATESSGGLVLPRPLDPPTLESGAHLNYAIQWFAFAAITLVGGGIFLRGRLRG